MLAKMYTAMKKVPIPDKVCCLMLFVSTGSKDLMISQRRV